MKKILVFGIIWVLVLLFLTCASNGNNASIVKGTETSSGEVFTGEGGKDLSLAIKVPAGMGLAADQGYLPTLIQGVFVDDVKKYSAIKVLDRLNLEKILKETESGIYKGEAEYGQLGQIANVDYVLEGIVTKTGSGYAMQIQITGTGKTT